MSDGTGRAAPPRGGGGRRAADWADSRLGVYGMARAMTGRAYPDTWSFLVGELCLYSFLILVLTGVYLSLYFHPSSNQVVYHGSYVPLRGQLMSEAFDSTLHLSFEVRGGLLIRQTHHWATLIFVAATFVHMMRVFFTGAFRKPRELNWVVGFALLILAMFEGLTGYDLPDDQLSGTGLAIVNGTLLSIPVVGTYLSFFLFGGEFPGDDLVARFNAVHVLLLPGLMVGLIVLHVLLGLRHGHTQYPGPGRSERTAVGMPLRAYAVKGTAYFFLVSGILFAIAATVQINPIWNYGPFRADRAYAGSQPDWYMAVADGLLRAMPGWETVLWGHTFAFDNFVPLLVGVTLYLAMGAYPFVENWVTDDDRDHHLIDRARDRPVRTGLGVAWLTAYTVAFAGAANDLIATHFAVSVNGVTWVVRIAFFVAPPVAYVVAKRVALGLQRHDREKVLHGRETGIIKRLQHGQFVEVHQPLGQDRLHTLTAHEQYTPYEAGPDEQRPGGRPRRTRRLRARLSRFFYGEGTQVPKATAEEYRKIAGKD